MKYIDARNRIKATEKLLREKTISRKKFESISAFFGIFGLFLDYILSSNYKSLKQSKKPTGFWSSKGGFWTGGSSSSGGGGGFGGGSSGVEGHQEAGNSLNNINLW